MIVNVFADIIGLRKLQTSQMQKKKSFDLYSYTHLSSMKISIRLSVECSSNTVKIVSVEKNLATVFDSGQTSICAIILTSFGRAYIFFSYSYIRFFLRTRISNVKFKKKINFPKNMADAIGRQYSKGDATKCCGKTDTGELACVIVTSQIFLFHTIQSFAVRSFN